MADDPARPGSPRQEPTAAAGAVPGDEEVSWPVVSSVDLHRDDWVLALRADTIRRPDGPPDGETFRRLVVELPGAAMVLAVDEADRAVLLQQYRHPAASRLLEVPAGLLDHPGEDPLECAQRELREEVALRADRWQHLLTVRPSPGMTTETHAIFLATGLHPVDRGGFVLEHEEAEMSVVRVPVDALLDAVLAGRVHDAPLVTAVLAYDVMRRRGDIVESQPAS